MSIRVLNPSRYYLIGLLAFFALLATRARAQMVTNTDPNFTLQVPNGFAQYPADPDSLYIFATSDPANGPPDAAVAIQRLRGTIGRERARLPKDAAPGSQLTTTRWKSFDVDVMAEHISANGVDVERRVAQIPIARHAVQIVVMVPASSTADPDAILQSFVSGLDGPSNWSAELNNTPSIVGAVSALLVILLISGSKAAKAAKAAARVERSDRRSLPGRHIRSRMIAVVLSVLLFVVIFFGGMIAISRNPGGDYTNEQRGELISIGAVTMSLWSFSAVYGIARLIMRIGYGPVRAPMAPAIAAGSDASSADVAARWAQLNDPDQ